MINSLWWVSGFWCNAAAWKHFVSNDIFASVTLWFVKRKCYICKLLIALPKQCVILMTLIWENISICYAAETGQNFSLNHRNAMISPWWHLLKLINAWLADIGPKATPSFQIFIFQPFFTGLTNFIRIQFSWIHWNPK